MKLAYLVHDLNDPAVERRLRQLRAAGVEVALAGFRRGSEAPAAVAGFPAIDLGRTADAALVRRIGTVLSTAWRARNWARLLDGADAVMARQLEMLALAARARAVAGSRAPLVYECLDVHRLLVSPKPPGRLLRALEGALLRRTARLLVSSPAFLREHFERAYPNRVPPAALVENRVLEEELAPAVRHAPPAPPPAGPPWRIGWFGVLRCARSLELLRALCERFPGQVEVTLRGRPALTAIPEFHERVRGVPGLRFDGPYDRRTDLTAMYGNVHFTWAMDFFEAGANSDWLLPNRLYEGGAHGTVPIALASVETGRWLAARGAGILLSEPLEEALPAWFAALTPARWEEASAASARVPRDAFVDGADAAERLAGLLVAEPA